MHLHDTAFYVALFFILGIAAAGLGINIWVSVLVSLFLGLSGLDMQEFLVQLDEFLNT